MVEAVQRALSERGFDPGKIDGDLGSRTRSAIGKFQRSSGLPDTGKIDEATLTALGLAPPGDAEPETGPGAEASETGTPPAMPSPEPDPDASESRAPRDETTPAPGTETPEEAQAPSAGPSAEPGSDTPETEAPRADPAPERAARRELSFATLGWHRPQTGTEALARFNALGLSRDFNRGTSSLFVPNAELVFVLQPGERIPGLDCDPGAGRLSIEFVFEPDGPVIFTPVADGEYCRMGIGIAIEVGRTLEMRRVDWGDMQYPRGTVRVTNQGLEYVRSST